MEIESPMTNKSFITYNKLKSILAAQHNYHPTPKDDIHRVIQSSLIEQRSQAWYDMRKNLVTGSKIATILKTNKYEMIYDFIGREVLGNIHPTIFPPPVMFQEALDHGICYEEIIKMQFENIHDLNVIEAGLVQHTTLPIAASPDGVITGLNRKCTELEPSFFDEERKALDFQLLEIKCPYRRKVFESGTLFDIVPKYYYSQMQCQMECTGSDVCYFYQAKIVTISKGEYLAKKRKFDKSYNAGQHTADNILIESVATEETSQEHFQQDQNFVAVSHPINTRTLLGMTIKAYENNDKGTQSVKYFHPFSLNLDADAYDKWFVKTLDAMGDKYTIGQDSVKYWEVQRISFIVVHKDARWRQEAEGIIGVYQTLKDRLLNDNIVQQRFIRRDKRVLYKEYNDIHLIVEDLYRDETAEEIDEILHKHEKRQEEEKILKEEQLTRVRKHKKDLDDEEDGCKAHVPIGKLIKINKIAKKR